MEIKSIILIVLLCVCSANCVKILGIFPFIARSHFFLGSALMNGLADAGHDVTIIAPYENEKRSKNGTYKTVLLTGVAEAHNAILKEWNLMESNDANTIDHPFLAQKMVLDYLEFTFNHTNVQKLLQSEEKFDVVILEKIYNDALLGLAHHFQAPVILFSAISASPCVNSMVGNPEPFAYVRHYVTSFSLPMTFYERIHNSFLYIFQELMDQYYFLPQHEKLMKKYFPNAPSVYELYYNISFVFLNGHESYSQSVPLVPNMAPIGGFHIRPPKPLPQDLKTFLDDAKEGVIYFSLGSHLKVSSLAVNKRKALFKVLGKLNQKILMTSDVDDIEGRPKNIILKKWLPQSDLLAHPNIKLFITHGGLLSTTEAIYHGVPLLAIPVFADQHLNALSAESEGYALLLPYNDPNFGEEKLSTLLTALLTNPKFAENAKKRSELFHDRPLTAMDTVNYWVQYVVRHKGASHLRVAGIGLPWYKYHLLDIIGFFLVVILLIMCLLYKMFSVLFSKKPSKTNKKLKRN